MPDSDFHSKLLSTRAQFEARLSNGRNEILRGMYENMLFMLEHQWIEYHSKRFRRIPLKRGTPTPVTNMFKAVLGRVDAELSRVEPSLSFAPGSDKDDDRVAADMAKLVINHIEQVVHLDSLRAELSKGVVVMNNMYTLAGFDADAGETDTVPNWICPKGDEKFAATEAAKLGNECPKHKVPLEEDMAGGTEVPRGAPYLEVITPFEMWVDPTIKRIEDQPMLMIRRLRSLQWVQNKYPGKGARLDGYAAPSDLGMTYLQSIIRLACGGVVGTHGAGGTLFTNSETVDDLLILPCKDYPKGAMARIGGTDTVFEAHAEFTYHDGTPLKRGRPFLPVVHWGYDTVPGAHYCTGPADSLKGPQRNRNRLQAAVELYFARMANGIWAIPEGNDLKTIPGEEGAIISFNKDVGEPKRIEGARLPNAFPQRFEQIDNEMLKIAGIEEVLQGAAPGRVDSGYAMNILQQRAQARFANLYFGWEQSYQELARQLFLLFRNNAPDESFFAIKGEEARWQVAKVKAASLYGSVDIRVEAGSAQPKTQLQKRASYEQAMQMGLVDITDPMVRLTVIRALQVHELMNDTHYDDDAIAKEHGLVVDYARQHFDPESGELITPIEQLPPFPINVDPLVDNHQFHYGRHRVWMLSEEYRMLPPSVQNMMRVHLQHTMMMLQQQMMAQQPAQNGQNRQQGGDETGQKNESASAKGGGAAGRSERQQAAAA
jgi:hypothetical protein